MNALFEKIRARRAQMAVVGLGYVGLPLAIAAKRAGLPVIGFDIDEGKRHNIAAGVSYVEAVSDEALCVAKLEVTGDFSRLSEADVIVICVPTPLSVHRTPDLSAVLAVTDQIAAYGKSHTLVVLESTTWPGTTEEILAPALAHIEDVYLAFSPEREDPGNTDFDTVSIPKLVAGHGEDAGQLVTAFYETFLTEVVRVSSPSVAEAAKISENVFRAVNIALVNELKVIFDRMNIDVWEVIDAAATKPFGYMPFYPGPGLGGHCIPIDPFYLSWKAREFGLNAQFIELAGEINIAMPEYVITKLREVLDAQCGLALSKSRLLVVGAAYKKNVADLRESPAMEIMARLAKQGAQIECVDPHVSTLTHFDCASSLEGRATLPQSRVTKGSFDAVLILTDHDAVNYVDLAGLDLPIVDTRNVLARKKLQCTKVFKA